MRKLKKLSKAKIWDYFILVSRFLLGWTFLRYGFSKLVDGQFGLSAEDLSSPIQDLSLFQISWYLFDHEPFNSFVGISQLICGVLFIFNRTSLLGAFLFLPIVTTILIIDISFMPPAMAKGFAWRLSSYLLLDFLVLWHYREKLKIVWNQLWYNFRPKFKFPIWTYLILPIMAIVLEILIILPRVILQILSDPSGFWNSITKLFTSVL